MRYSNRSLWFAVLASMAMGFYAKSPSFVGRQLWITGVLFGATLVLSAIGIWWGVKGYRQERTWWSMLGAFINSFLFLSFVAFNVLIYRALQNLQ